MLLNLTENEYYFFLLREAFCGLEYAENAFAAAALPRTPWEAHDALPEPLVVWGGNSPPDPTPLGAFGVSTLAPPTFGSAPPCT